MALRCSRVPVALPCHDLCVLNKCFPGHHLGKPPSLEALGCISPGRKEFRGIYQALGTSTEVFAVQKVPFLYQKACWFCSPEPGWMDMVTLPGGHGELWVPITSLSSLFKRKVFKIFPKMCFELLSNFLFLLHPSNSWVVLSGFIRPWCGLFFGFFCISWGETGRTHHHYTDFLKLNSLSFCGDLANIPPPGRALAFPANAQPTPASSLSQDLSPISRVI